VDDSSAPVVPLVVQPIRATERKPGSIYAVGLTEPVSAEVWESINEYLTRLGKPHGITFFVFEGVTLLDPSAVTKY
jgi:hypothetical protein